MFKANYLLIGYGYWGPNVARNINKSKISNLKVVIDIDDESIKKAKNDSVSEYYFDSIEKLNSEIMKDIDVIVVTTPPSSHFRIINSLSKYKKTFLIAKPLCTNAKEVEKIEKLTEKYNLEIFTDETFVYSNKVKAIKKIINSDDFGKLQYISSVRSNLGLIQKDQNVIWDLVPHDLSIVSFVTSYYPLSGKAIATNSLSNVNSTDNISYVEFQYENNLKLFLNVSWVSPEKIRYMVFCGTKQTLVYDDNKKLISEIKPFDLENLIKWKVVQGGMIPKIQNCVDAVENGVKGVVILDGRKPHSILHEIFSDKGSGTLIRK